MRDAWWEQVALEKSTSAESGLTIIAPKNRDKVNKKHTVAIYHLVYKHEDFNTSANMIFELIKNSQEHSPGAKRCLFLDIDNHRNQQGGFDHDMYELQAYFLSRFMFKYLTEIHMPLISVKNPNKQLDDVPSQLTILPENGLGK